MTTIADCGKNVQRLWTAIQDLRKEIPNALEIDQVIPLLAAVERLRTLERKHLLRNDPAHPGQKIPINNAYQTTPSIALLHLLEDHIAEVQELLKIRQIIDEGVDDETDFLVVSASVREYIQEHRPAKLQGQKVNHHQQQQSQRVMAHLAEIDDGDMYATFGEDDEQDGGVEDHHEIAGYASSTKRIPCRKVLPNYGIF